MSLVGKLHIDGLFEGSISSLDSITVGRRGQIKGVVRADQVSVSGRIDADIQCNELIIERGGHVCGVVHSQYMTIHKQGVFIGQRALTRDSSLMSPQQLEQNHPEDPPQILSSTRTDHPVIELPETQLPETQLPETQQQDSTASSHQPEHLTQMLENMLGEVPRVGVPPRHDPDR